VTIVTFGLRKRRQRNSWITGLKNVLATREKQKLPLHFNQPEAGNLKTSSSVRTRCLRLLDNCDRTDRQTELLGRPRLLRRQTDLGDVGLPENIEHINHVLGVHLISAFDDDPGIGIVGFQGL